MKKSILIFLAVLTHSCNSNYSADKDYSELIKLRAENDSLKGILQEIDNKYVFDSVSIREIKNADNTYKRNSLFKSKFYIIGYNTNPLTHFVKIDSDLNQIDTLNLQDGGYEYLLKLDEDKNTFKAYINIENKYGKIYAAQLLSTISPEE